MALFITFLFTGIVTILPVVYMLMGAWMGVPVVLTEYFAFAGSCCMMSAAYVSFFSRKTASVMGLIGVAGIASFYLVEGGKAIRQGGFSLMLLIILGTVIVTLVWSAYAAISTLRTLTPKREVGSKSRKLTLSISGFLLLMVTIGGEWQHKASERHPSRYEIPDGYVGWVVIHHGVHDAPTTQVMNGKWVFKFPDSGELTTKTDQEFGEAKDDYFYYLPDGRLRVLPNTGWGKGGMIWGDSSGTYEEPGKPEDRREQFFVGTEQQFNRMQNLPELREGIVAKDLREELR